MRLFLSRKSIQSQLKSGEAGIQDVLKEARETFDPVNNPTESAQTGSLNLMGMTEEIRRVADTLTKNTDNKTVEISEPRVTGGGK